MSIATELQRVIGAKSAIKTAIENKGVTVGSVLIDDYASKINEITSSTSSTPSPIPWSQEYYESVLNSIPEISTDLLELPTLVDGQQRMVGIHTVYDHDSNFLSLSAAGAYTIDWGDGTIENYDSGVQCYHNYNYSSFSGQTVTTLPYKQAIVSITPQSGRTLTALNFGLKHNQSGLQNYSGGWIDIKIVGNSINSLSLKNQIEQRSLIRFNYIGNNLITNFSSMFVNCYSLITLPLLDTALGTNFGSMFVNCTSLTTIPLLDTALGTNFVSMFQNCYSLTTIPLLNTALGTNFNSMFYNCYSITTIPLLNIALGTNFGSMFQYCFSLTTLPLLNTALGTNFSYMFYNCTSLITIPLLNTGLGTNFGNMFQYCYSLITLPLMNTGLVTNFGSMFQNCTTLSKCSIGIIKYSISFLNCRLSRASIVEIFNSLSTASGQSITITGNWGVNNLTEDDRLIATNKGWTIIG